MPKVIVTVAGNPEEKVFPLGMENRVGRLPECSIQLSGAGISREHAKIISENNQYYIVDLESANGTLLNGLLLKPHEKNVLRNEDQVTIESYHLRFWETDELFEEKLKEEEEITDDDILEIKLLKKVIDAVDQETIPTLEILNGSQEGKRAFVTDESQEMIIGRDPNCDFCINEYVISRQHAKLQKKWGGIALVDLESKNGCYVNNKRVTEEFLHDGDRIALGTILLLFRNPQEINVEALGEELKRQRPPLLKAGKKPKIAAKEEARESAEGAEEKTGGSPEETEEILKDIPSLKPAAANSYPLPVKEKRLNPLEIGLIGLGVAVLCFAAITLVNLIFE